MTDLAGIALGSTVAGAPAKIIQGIGSAGLVGLEAWKKLRESERKK